MVQLMRRIGPVVLISVLLAGCSGSTASEKKLTVVATFSIAGDIVRAIGGDSVSLTTLVGPESDAHTFEPTPGDAKAVGNARAVFAIGVGFEPWLERLVSASKSKATMVELSKGQQTLTLEEDGKTEPDPHLWHDPTRMVKMVEIVRDTLVKLDAANRATYEQNARTYSAKLVELDSWAQAQVNTIPAANRKLVTLHDSLGYLADHFGFTFTGAAVRALSTEAEPNAQETANLIAEIKANNVKAIFPENITPSRLLDRVSRDSGAKLAPPLCSDSLSKPGGPCATYLDLMRFNITTIVTALQ